MPPHSKKLKFGLVLTNIVSSNLFLYFFAVKVKCPICVTNYQRKEKKYRFVGIGTKLAEQYQLPLDSIICHQCSKLRARPKASCCDNHDDDHPMVIDMPETTFTEPLPDEKASTEFTIASSPIFERFCAKGVVPPVAADEKVDGRVELVNAIADLAELAKSTEEEIKKKMEAEFKEREDKLHATIDKLKTENARLKAGILLFFLIYRLALFAEYEPHPYCWLPIKSSKHDLSNKFGKNGFAIKSGLHQLHLSFFDHF